MKNKIFFQGLALLHSATHPLKFPNTMSFADRLIIIYCDF